MQVPRANVPPLNSLSVFTATILLAYVLARGVTLPGWEGNWNVFGISLALTVNFDTLVAALAAGLTAAGTHALMQAHPTRQADAPTVQHWLLPTLTAWALGAVLRTLPGLWWWVGFGAGGGLLLLTLLAEYASVSPEDSRYLPASAGLVALAFGLYLALAVALQAANTRLYLVLPALMGAALLVALRVYHLRLEGVWHALPALVTALLSTELAAALHYFPLSPVRYGLLLTAFFYALVTLITGLLEARRLRSIVLEAGVTLILTVLLALWWFG
ncbi:MAG: hypothetical protein OHK0052_05480 [Anaerolineales bacterium]